MKIALVTDTHISPGDKTLTANWRATERWFATVNPDLIIHLGDITANGVHDARELRHAHQILTASPFKVHFLPGNHDIGDHPPGPGIAPHDPLDLTRLAEYRAIFGLDFWAVTMERWLFVGLDALLLGTDCDAEAAQHRWLEETVVRHNGPIGLFLHKPLFQSVPDECIVHERYVPRAARRRLMAAFSGHDLGFVCAGHTHQTRQFRVDGTDHVWVPSAAFVIPDSLQDRIGDKLVGVMMLEIEGDKHKFTHVVPAGMAANSLLDYGHIYPELAARMADRRDGNGDG